MQEVFFLLALGECQLAEVKMHLRTENEIIVEKDFTAACLRVAFWPSENMNWINSICG